MDIPKLLSALDNETNESIINLTTDKIVENNLNIILELGLERNVTIDYMKKIKNYKYVDELSDLKYGSFIRWIPIIDPNSLPLQYCGIICDVKIADDGVFVVCKNFMHRHYTFKMDECLIFQKLTNQELVLLSALDYLEQDNEL
jgi:hypothetical protein